MPSKFRIKTYVAESFYHLYNRGVEKRQICIDDQDYAVLLSYMKTYLEPKDENGLQQELLDPTLSYREKQKVLKLLRLNNFYDTIQLLAYSIMPNHFHFEVKQTEYMAIDKLMNSLWTRYTYYFNNKYKRVGSLFQDVYKAVLINTQEQLLYLSRYIHRNSIAKRHFRNPATQGLALRGYNYSSYPEYVGLRQTAWVHPEIILSYFSTTGANSYTHFVESSDFDEISALTIAPIIIDA